MRKQRQYPTKSQKNAAKNAAQRIAANANPLSPDQLEAKPDLTENLKLDPKASSVESALSDLSLAGDGVTLPAATHVAEHGSSGPDATPSVPSASEHPLEAQSSPPNAISPSVKYKVITHATASDIDSAQPGDILNFGNGFQLKVDAKGAKHSMHFQQRFTIAGASSTKNIGQFPDFSFEQAKKLSDKMRKDVRVARSKNRLTTFKSRLGKSEAEEPKFATFHNMEDAGQFLRNLNKVYSKTEVSRESLHFFILLLHIPVKPQRLLMAQWDEVLIQDKIHFYWPFKKTKEGIGESADKGGMFLSGEVMDLLHSMLKYKVDAKNKQNESISPLFPTFLKKTPSARDEVLSTTLQKIWPRYPLDLDGFRYFFKKMACENSGFKPDFIADVMSGRAYQKSKNCQNVNLQLSCLANWWSNELGFYLNPPPVASHPPRSENYNEYQSQNSVRI